MAQPAGQAAMSSARPARAPAVPVAAPLGALPCRSPASAGAQVCNSGCTAGICRSADRYAAASGSTADGGPAAAVIAARTIGLVGLTARGCTRRSRGRRACARRPLVACAAEEADSASASASSSEPDVLPADEAIADALKDPLDEEMMEDDEAIADAPKNQLDEEMMEEDEDAELEKIKKEKEASKPKKWTCTSCEALNFEQVKECHKCGASKPSRAEMALVNEKRAAQDAVDKTLDEFIRLQADLQNYRRSHQDAMSRTSDLGKQDALRKLVPFTLDVDEAISPPDGLTEKQSKFFDSYSLLFGKIHRVWDKMGVKKMDTKVGEKLNPESHRKAEARQVEGQAAGTIVEVLEPGWTLEGKVIIPAEVATVAFPEPPPVPVEAEKKEEKEADEKGDTDAE